MEELYKGDAPNDKTGTPARQAAQMINDNFAYLNNKISNVDQIIIQNGYSLVDQDLTMNAGWVWNILGTEYTNPVDVISNIPFCADGLQRFDMFVLNQSNTFSRIAGAETETPVKPPKPVNTIEAFLVLVGDDSVGDPSTPIIGENYKLKSESNDFIVSGSVAVFDVINIPDNRNSISLTGSVTDIKSIQVNDEFVYPGKPHFVKNRSGHDITIWHNAGTGNIKYSFPNSANYVIKPNEVLEFSTNANDSSVLKFEFIGGSVVDLSSKADITYVDAGLATKLNASDYNDRFKGKYLTEADLRTAHPTASVGDSAQVNPVGSDTVVNYNWDDELGDWVVGGSGASISNTDELLEGSSNLYWTTARGLALLLTGLSFVTGGAIVSTDSVLVAFGKIQKQINDNVTAVGLKLTANTAITGATKTKLTYDSKGLVTSGTDATTADIADSTNKRYQTDAQNTNNDATSPIQAQINGKQPSLGFTAENTANKDASGGYAGLTLFKINFRNVANTFTSFFTNANTASRTYTFQNRDGIIADINNTQTFTGDQTFAGKANFSASTATKESFNIADGVVKTTPVNGDFWRIGVDWFFKSATYVAKNMWQDQPNSALSGATVRALAVDATGMPVTNAVVGLVLNTVTLVAGVATITISGVTTSSICIATQLITSGGVLGFKYKAVCTSNTLTITAVDNTGSTVTTDTSTLSYTVQI